MRLRDSEKKEKETAGLREIMGEKFGEGGTAREEKGEGTYLGNTAPFGEKRTNSHGPGWL